MQNGEILLLLLRAVSREITSVAFLPEFALKQENYKCNFSSLLRGNPSSHKKGKTRQADQLSSPPFWGGRQPASPPFSPGLSRGPAPPGRPPALPVPVHGADPPAAARRCPPRPCGRHCAPRRARAASRRPGAREAAGRPGALLSPPGLSDY